MKELQLDTFIQMIQLSQSQKNHDEIGIFEKNGKENF